MIKYFAAFALVLSFQMPGQEDGRSDACFQSPQTCEVVSVNGPRVPLPVPEPEPVVEEELAYTGSQTQNLVIGGSLLLMVGLVTVDAVRRAK